MWKTINFDRFNYLLDWFVTGYSPRGGMAYQKQCLQAPPHPTRFARGFTLRLPLASLTDPRSHTLCSRNHAFYRRIFIPPSLGACSQAKLLTSLVWIFDLITRLNYWLSSFELSTWLLMLNLVLQKYKLVYRSRACMGVRRFQQNPSWLPGVQIW